MEHETAPGRAAEPGPEGGREGEAGPGPGDGGDVTGPGRTEGEHGPTGLREPADPAWLAIVYFAIYLVYLFATLESEFMHWVTMIVIPVALVAVYAGPGRRLRRTLASLGLRWGALRHGLGWAIGLSIAVSFFQIGMSRMGDDIVALLTSNRALIALPFTMLFLLLTTALTEEMLFRGYLQTRLERLTGSKWWGLILASVLFGLYHLPYAYLNPRWPSAGDWGDAFAASLGQGIPGGLILGGLFLRGRKNLLGPIILHACVDLLPAATMLKFGGQ
jgi:membrane protease YdiL (CAAX protease family)